MATETAVSPDAPEHLEEREHRPDRPMPTNVIEALARVMLEMPAIGKDKEMTEGQKYSYRSIEAITSHASTLFGRYGIVVKPHKTKRYLADGRPYSYQSRGGTNMTQEYIKVKYRIYGPGGKKDRITTAWFHAIANDMSDKGTNKAMTQAKKQMLLDLLMIGDNKDDPDTYSGESTAASTGGPREIPWEEWLAESGWESTEHYQMAKRRVYDAIRALDLSSEEKRALWKDYLRPDKTLDQDAPRDRASYDEWWEKNLAAAAESPQEPERAPTPPEPAATPETGGQGPEVAHQPTQPPAPAAAPEAPAQEPQAQPQPVTDLMGALEESLAKAKAATDSTPEFDQPEPEIPADNGFRSAADNILRDAGPDELFKYLAALPVTDVARELTNRGVALAGKHQPHELRRHLGSIVIARRAGGPAAEPPAAEPPAQGRARRR